GPAGESEAVGNRHAELQTIVLPTGDIRMALLTIHVHAEANRVAEVIAEAATVTVNHVNALRVDDRHALAVAIGQILDAAASDDVDRAENLLRQRRLETGLKVVGLGDVERVRDVARRLEAEPRHAEQHISEVDGGGRPSIPGEAGHLRLEVAETEPRGAF